MGRAPCCDKANVKKGPWSPEEDTKLKEFIEKYGTGGTWIALPRKAGLKRCGKSCRLRWLNYLRPNIKHGEFSEEEDRVICSLFAAIGSSKAKQFLPLYKCRWSIIASQLPGRTDNDIKNYWNTKLKKKLLGISPSQRKPHQRRQHHQNQHLFPSPSPSLQGSTYTTPKPLLTSCEGIPVISEDIYMLDSLPTSTIASSLLQVPYDQYQRKGSNNMITFGSDQSCSSSDRSCSKFIYGKDLSYDYVGGGDKMGIEQYIYGDIEENKLFLGGGCQESSAMDYNYEEIKELLIPHFGCNNGSMNSYSLYLDDTIPNVEREKFKDPVYN